MAIIGSDIKLYESQNMNDTSDGGGAIANIEVSDATDGNVFPFISEVDKLNGKISHRKLYIKIDSENNDLCGEVHAIITSISNDTGVFESIICDDAETTADLPSSTTRAYGASILSDSVSASENTIPVSDFQSYYKIDLIDIFKIGDILIIKEGVNEETHRIIGVHPLVAEVPSYDKSIECFRYTDYTPLIGGFSSLNFTLPVITSEAMNFGVDLVIEFSVFICRYIQK